MPPPVSRKTLFRLARLHTRLMAQVEVLDAVPRDARRAPMPKPMRGAGRRLIAEAEALVPLRARLYRRPRKPGDLAASTLVALASLKALSSQLKSRSREEMDGTFPRSPDGE